MTNRKSLRRAFLSSALAMVICASMLVGTTFAWFTDTATTRVNTIQAGTLDVALEVSYDGGETWQNAEGQSLEFMKAESDREEDLLWEPGCTYSLPQLRIVNKGNLALKYKVLITGIQGDTELNEAIEWTILVGDSTYALNDEHVLEENSQSHPLIISGHMREDAGDEYQGLSIENVSITVYATQYTYEHDSNDNQYDADAPLPVFVANQTEFNEALQQGADRDIIVKLPSNSTLTLDNNITTRNNVTFIGDGTQTIDVVENAITAEGGELNYQRGSRFTFKNLTIQAGEGNFDGLVCDGATYTNCTIKGKLTLYSNTTFTNCVFENTMTNQYSIWTWGSNIATFEGCTFRTSNGKAILLYGGAGVTTTPSTTLNVNNCTFIDSTNGIKNKAVIETGNDYNATYAINATNNTIIGFAIHQQESTEPYWINTNTKMYANKTGMDATHLIVTSTNNVETDIDADLLISSPAELVAFEQAVNAGNSFAGKKVALVCDIDLTGIVWNPIGQSSGKEFKGSFDGMGHTIKKLTIRTPNTVAEAYASGLFGWSHGNIKNLNIDGANIQGSHYVGAIVGYQEFGTVSNCTVKNAVIDAPHHSDALCGDKVGAVIGYVGPNTTAKIENCHAKDCTIRAARDAGYVIGVAGILSNVTGCTADNVTVSYIGDCEHDRAGQNLGGIISNA